MNSTYEICILDIPTLCVWPNICHLYLIFLLAKFRNDIAIAFIKHDITAASIQDIINRHMFL